MNPVGLAAAQPHRRHQLRGTAQALLQPEQAPPREVPPPAEELRGGLAAGVVVAKEAVTAGVRTGRSVGGVASQQVDAANQAAPSSDTPMPHHVADSIPAQPSGKKD